ncbi:hypothetical protein Pmar_PMAR021005 [Perkinsus marinus ATCC 50983]|uniref:Uncharacterized protein n=1 Tax=Perkinsus marinus (strain ATCC 50983 / TXsc) TaxID=423536 RepID=C5KG53_PERM5|nr:hypothetical protein Pmar_PMAR021005 [Perkinsus marinus ATCC 50983]EER16409.1 hypothetical protein Pmar_PMAR021005 [Perkinsus marinus ATCC 50983]|eukprot:XP_002784613.1 hypothetical protein Pmar_PMAR021005 [Perkinsus marinus ATCC 50983]
MSNTAGFGGGAAAAAVFEIEVAMAAVIETKLGTDRLTSLKISNRSPDVKFK